MSTNDHPEVGVPSAGPGNDPAPAATTNEPPASSSEPAEVADPSAQAQNSQQKSEDAVNAETKSAEGGESAAPAPANDTTVAPSTNAPQKASEDPAHAKEVEDPKEEQEEEEEDEGEDTGPSLVITLLLTSGSRHPFKINGKYLRKQSINVENNDPFTMSVYTLKELIWREWRPDWETRPSSPSSIRLISFGKLLEDKAPLSVSKFNRDAPNVVHMTIKPQEIVDEEDSKGAKTQYTRERDPSVRSPGCRCVIL